MKKKIILLFLLLFFPLAVLALAGKSHAAEWTFLVYLDGDNNLEGAGIDDVNEMEMVGSTPEVNIVVQFDRIDRYDTSNGDWHDTRRGIITKDSTSLIASNLTSVGEKNMGDPQTLTEFLSWGISTFPADHYFLVLWNHGDGWYTHVNQLQAALARVNERILQGESSPQLQQEASTLSKKVFEATKAVCWDDTDGDDALTMKECREALESINKKISDLSGGERNRLQLARLMLLDCNLLILDEPTNHLDIPTREAVEDALSEYTGTILVVSHDRYFLDKVVNHVAEVKDSKLQAFEGNFTDFWQLRKADTESITGRITNRGKAGSPKGNKKNGAGGQAWLQRKAQIAAERKARKALQQIEKKLNNAEQQKTELEQQTAQAFSEGNHDKGNKLSQQLNELITKIDDLLEQWTRAGEALEEAAVDYNPGRAGRGQTGRG